MAILTLIEAIPIKCFVSHRPTDPFFLERSKHFNLQAHDLVFNINTNCLKLSSILRFCSLFRHLILLLIYIFYHLIISCRLNVRFNMQSCAHSFFFLPDRPTHLHEREGDGKRNILWGWPDRWLIFLWQKLSVCSIFLRKGNCSLNLLFFSSFPVKNVAVILVKIFHG